jgi:anti-sigma B factor antagonist
MPIMVINEQKHDDIDIVALSGRFVMADAPEVRESLKTLIEAGQGKLVVNMESVTFIDSSACAVLISAFKAMQLKTGRLVLVNSPIVQSLIELTRLHTVFEIMPNAEAAIAALSAG